MFYIYLHTHTPSLTQSLQHTKTHIDTHRYPCPHTNDAPRMTCVCICTKKHTCVHGEVDIWWRYENISLVIWRWIPSVFVCSLCFCFSVFVWFWCVGWVFQLSYRTCITYNRTSRTAAERGLLRCVDTRHTLFTNRCSHSETQRHRHTQTQTHTDRDTHWSILVVFLL